MPKFLFRARHKNDVLCFWIIVLIIFGAINLFSSCSLETKKLVLIKPEDYLMKANFPPASEASKGGNKFN